MSIESLVGGEGGPAVKLTPPTRLLVLLLQLLLVNDDEAYKAVITNKWSISRGLCMMWG